MHALLSSSERWALHGSEATRRLEQAAMAALPFNTLMQRAGQASARLARALAPHARRAWVLVGPGNNGGDGLEAARHLQTFGIQVHVTFIGSLDALPHDARAAHHRALLAGVAIHPADAPVPPIGPQDVALDALFGLGARRAPGDDLVGLIERFNALACVTLAIDLPSGLHPDTGQPLGAACIRATHTLTLLTAKPGLFTGAGRDCAGQAWLDTLGVDTSLETPDAWLAGPPVNAEKRLHAQHKGSFGDVAVVGGAPGMQGAALLAARAAHAAGAGRVYVDPLDEGLSPGDPWRPELMWRPGWSAGELPPIRQSTVVCGCGGGNAVRHRLPTLLAHAPRLVLDADALNAIAADPALQQQLVARDAAGRVTVMTPHPLEAARLLQIDTASVQADRLDACRRLANRFGCVVVLKGSGSVVASPSHTPVINPTGNAALATAGTGDVLAGWLGGRWASCGEAMSRDAAFDVSTEVVWTHGRAADLSDTCPLLASKLIESMAGIRKNA